MDYYLEDLSRLDDQPKRSIADYVEQNGILVPRRFDSLTKAKASGLPIIARGEHPQDYAGASGILESPKLQWDEYKDVQSEEELKLKALAEPENGISLHRQFCQFSNYDEERFKAETSFSFWELLEGYNRTVVADTAISNRHHVMTFLDSQGKGFFNYAIVENGIVAQEFIQPFTPELREDLPALIDFYERVRHLERFDKNHCPIMEIQTRGDKNYFLQYHRTRDFEPATFRLERSLEKGEIEVPFVRGATQESGVQYKITVYYAHETNWKFNPEDEDGSWDLHYNHVFPELQLRQRKVQMTTNTQRNVWWELFKYVVHHLQRSKLFKPQISIIGNIEHFLFDGETTSDFYERTRNGHNSYMTLNIVSDGRRSFVKREK